VASALTWASALPTASISRQVFYPAIGFRDVYAHHWWVKRV